MKKARKTILTAAGIIMMLILFGCGPRKYELVFDGAGFESESTEYAPGEEVTVHYGIIATDTDYRFFADDDVKLTEDYDEEHGYIFTFVMPEHDVTLSVESHNSMIYDPELEERSEKENAAAADQ